MGEDRLTRTHLPALGCGLAVALQLAGADHHTLVEAVLWVAGLAGIRALTDNRVPKFVLAAPVIEWFAYFVRDLVYGSESLVPPGRFAYAAVAVASFLVAIAFAITVLAAAPKVGWPLAGLAFAGLVANAGATALDRNAALLQSDVTRLMHPICDVVRDASSFGIGFVPIVWIALAVSPFAIEEFASRKLALLGAIGAGICSNLIDGLGDSQHRDPHWHAIALYSIGWLLLILSTFALARSMKSGRAWFGFAICIVQVFACPGLLAGLNAANAQIAVAMSMAFGMIGLALTAFTSGLPLRRFRLVVGIVLALGAFGSFATDLGVMLDLNDILRIKGDPSKWWTADLAFWGAHWGMKLWCATLALLATRT